MIFLYAQINVKMYCQIMLKVCILFEDCGVGTCSLFHIFTKIHLKLWKEQIFNVLFKMCCFCIVCSEWENEILLQKFGVKEHEVHNALLSGDPHDQLAIAYHLIIDNKRIADEAAKAELKDFYVASSPPPISFSPSELNPSPIRPHPERIARKLLL